MGHPQAGRFRLRGIARAGTAQAAGIAADWHRVAKHFLFQPRVVGSQDRCLSGERTAGPGGGRVGGAERRRWRLGDPLPRAKPSPGRGPRWHFLDVALHVGARLSLGDRNLRPGPVMTQLQQQKK